MTNPSSGVQYLTDVTVTVANPDGTTWIAVPGCSAADYTVDAPVIPYGSIAPGDVVNGTVTITMDDTGANQNACKGATVPLYFLASGPGPGRRRPGRRRPGYSGARQ